MCQSLKLYADIRSSVWAKERQRRARASWQRPIRPLTSPWGKNTAPTRLHSDGVYFLLERILLAFVTAVLLLDFALIGMLLRMRFPSSFVFILSAGNPVQAARLALLSAVEPELSTLGPVGFFLANRLGANFLLLIGLGWPAVFGGTCLFVAARCFRSSDLL